MLVKSHVALDVEHYYMLSDDSPSLWQYLNPLTSPKPDQLER